MGHRSGQALLILRLSEAYVLADRLEDALELAGRALALARERGQRGREAWALRLLGEVAAHRNPPELESAESAFREAAALAMKLGMRPLVAHCHLGLGKLYRRTDKREQAKEHFATATTMYREMGMTYWLEKAEAELG
jgi:tetratricopeptide (TPR) repeat protein